MSIMPWMISSRFPFFSKAELAPPARPRVRKAKPAFSRRWETIMARISDPSTGERMDQLIPEALRCYAWRQAHEAITREVLRHELEPDPAYTARCPQCRVDHDDAELTLCPTCATKLAHPPPKERAYLEGLLAEANGMGQSLADLLAEAQRDLNIWDDMYLLLDKSYELDAQGRITGARVDEVVRLDPALVSRLYSPRGAPRSQYGVCIPCRDQSLGAGRPYAPTTIPPRGAVPPCRECGGIIYRARHIYRAEGGDFYAIAGEVISGSHHTPGARGGVYPPLYTLGRHIILLNRMDEMEQRIYTERRLPHGFVAWPGVTPASLAKQQAEVLAKLQSDPNYVPWVSYQPVAGGEKVGKPEFVSSLGAASTMQSTEHRHEHARIISSYYGVSPVLMGDVQVSGGLNNETQQLAVSDRAVQSLHGFWERRLDEICAEAGITGWRLRFRRVEHEDARAELERHVLMAQLAQHTRDTPGAYLAWAGEEVLDYAGVVEGQAAPEAVYARAPAKRMSPDEAEDAARAGDDPPGDGRDEIRGLEARVHELERHMDQQFEAMIGGYQADMRADWTYQQAGSEYERRMAEYRRDIQDFARAHVAAVYEAGHDQAVRDTGIDIPITPADEMVQEVLIAADQPGGVLEQLAHHTDELLLDLLDPLRELYERPEGFILEDAVALIRDHTGMADSRAEMVARTMCQTIATEARTRVYRQDPFADKYEYMFVGADDHDVCDVCSALMAMGPWPSLEDAEDAIAAESALGSAHTAHPRCRHTIARRLKR